MSFTATSDINLELLNPGTPRIIHAKQGESYTREVSIHLYENNVPWVVPSGATFQVCYAKPDGKGGTFGSYTKGGTSYPAVTVSSNTLKVSIIPQMLEVAGMVRCEVHMQSAAILAYNERLSTFTFLIDVQQSAESNITSTDYWKAASADKIVLLNAEVGATADVSTTHNVNDFLSTPHVGDTVIGTNNYIAKVTAASGSTITIKATGEQWSISTAQEATFRVTVTRTGKAAFTADGTLAQIKVAYNEGKSVQCIYKNEYDQWFDVILPLTYVNADAATFSAVDSPAQGEMPFVMLRVTNSGSGDVWADLSQSVTTDAGSVAWSGRIGEYSVNNVASAIEAIGIGLGQVHETPDMTDDYEASGATSVQQWATMAKDGSPSVYRVNEGQYVVSPSDDWRSYVSITSDGDGLRYVTVRQYSDESFFYVYVWCTGAAGGEPQRVAYFSTEGELNFINGYNYLLPYAVKADAGKFLRIGASGGSPIWEKLTYAAIPDAPYTTIQKIKAVSSSPYIIVRMHNLDPSRTYTLRAYTVSRHGGSNYGDWYTPRDYTEEATDSKRQLGYGLLADRLIDNDRYPAKRFAVVPDWMPNDGYIQTQWEIPAGPKQLKIDPHLWLVPLVKPHIPQDASSWDGSFVVNPGTSRLSADLIGIGRKAHAGKLFRFCLTDDTGRVFPCRNTLKVFRRRTEDSLEVYTGGEVASITNLQISVF